MLFSTFPNFLKVRTAVWLALFLCLSFLYSGGRALAQQAEAPDRELVIGTKIAAPFVMKTAEGEWTGLSIELWQRIADQLHVRYRFVEEPNIQSLLEGVESRKYDAAIAAITVTAARARKMEFSLPYYQSGLGIAVPSSGPAIWQQILRALVSVGFAQAVGALIGITLLVGTLVWLFERRHNEDFGAHGVKGLGTSMWWTAEAMTQASTGNLGPRTLPGRILAVFWMVTSIIAIAVFTAGVTSAITASKLQGIIRGEADLPSVRVGTVAGAATVDYLTANRIKSTPFKDIEEGLRALETGRVDAFVHDRPLLSWFVLHRAANRVEVIDDTFDPQSYAIAFPSGSELRWQVSIAALEISESDWWREALFRNLGER